MTLLNSHNRSKMNAFTPLHCQHRGSAGFKCRTSTLESFRDICRYRKDNVLPLALNAPGCTESTNKRTHTHTRIQQNSLPCQGFPLNCHKLHTHAVCGSRHAKGKHSFAWMSAFKSQQAANCTSRKLRAQWVWVDFRNNSVKHGDVGVQVISERVT